MKKEEGSLRKMSYRKSDKRREDNIERQKLHRSRGTILSAPDKVLLITVSFLIIIGFMAIFSASAPKCIEEGGNPVQLLFKQFRCLIIGLFCLRVFTKYDYKTLAEWNMIFAGIIIVLLILVDFTPLGVMVNGAKRWINLLGFQLQPSEFAKPAVVLMLASIFRKDADLFDKNKWVNAFIPILAMVFFIFILLFYLLHRNFLLRFLLNALFVLQLLLFLMY